MVRSDTIQELAAALAAAQALIKPAAKDSENPHFKSRYADLAAVWEACREPLSSNGLSVVQTFEQDVPGQISVLTTLLHKSGEWITSTLVMPVSQASAHGVGSAITYGRRYGIAALIGVVADEDDDGNAASQGSQTSQAQPQPAQQRNGARRVGNTTDQAIARGHLNPDTLDPKLGKFTVSFEGWMKSKQLDPNNHELAMFLLNRAAENDDESAWTSRKELTEDDWKRTGRTLVKLPTDELTSWIEAHSKARLRAEVHPSAELVVETPAEAPEDVFGSEAENVAKVEAEMAGAGSEVAI